MSTTETLRIPAAVQVRRLHRRYGDRVVLNELDLDIARGEFVALIGVSGCGKTTLLRAIAGLDIPDGGTITAPTQRAIVFQEPRLLPWKRVGPNVALTYRGANRQQRVRDALAEVQLEEHTEAWPIQLSGGQAQRVALARALVTEPELLLLDEPFGALDALTRIKMHGLVRQLVAAHQPAVLLVTHDVDEAIALSDRIVVMRDGRIAATHVVDGDAHRNRAQLGFARLRSQLLTELSVDDELLGDGVPDGKPG
jgi:sulfonate transport system ATP-binding protein